MTIDNIENNVTLDTNQNMPVTVDDFFDELFPKYGSAPRPQTPTWDSSNLMFIFEQHYSPEGNLYYRGIRFSDCFAIVENIGLFHSWTYIDSIEVYKINGKEMELLQKKHYKNIFREVDFVKSEVENMVEGYAKSQKKMQKKVVDDNLFKQKAKQLVADCYKDFNKDGYYSLDIMKLLHDVKPWDYEKKVILLK